MDLMVSPLLSEISSVFKETNKARMFALFRHPVDRGVSTYYNLLSEKASRGMLKGSTLEEYSLRSDMVENNYMTRMLCNKTNTEELTSSDELTARLILKHKCLIGLLSQKSKGFERFEKYFGWKVRGERMQVCHDRFMVWDWSRKKKHLLFRPNSPIWKNFEKHNMYDIRLYHYAEDLFYEQGAYLDELWEERKNPQMRALEW